MIGRARDRIRTSPLGAKLRRRAQKVAVITYTKAARDEITRRTKFDPLISVSTIHRFAWILIEGFDHDIREWLRVALKEDIAELIVKEQRGRKGTQASADRLTDIASKQKRLDRLDSIRRFVYSPDTDNFGRDSLNHAEVLKIAGDLVRTKRILQKIIRDGYPIILVDESQDTNRHIVEALFELQKEHRDEIVVGLFGDMMQRIYGDGQPALGENLPADWAKPTKQLNFRCPRRVIKLINKVREATDGQQQVPRSTAVEGHVRLFILPSEGTDKGAAEATVCADMAEVTGDAEWPDVERVKTLILEHRMAAIRMGFDTILGALAPVSRFRTGLMDGTLPLVTFFTQLVLPLNEKKNDRFAVAQIVRSASPLLSAEALKASQDGNDQLVKAKAAADSLIALLSSGPAVTLRDVAENVRESGLFALPERLRLALENVEAPVADPSPKAVGDEDDELNQRTDIAKAIDAFLAAPVTEVAPYARYVASKARFDTHQGVKGLEFPRVMVVMDDEEARGFQFKYEKLFNSVPSDDATTAATRRLFYVTCSRAEKSLALVAYTTNPQRIRDVVLARGWFEAAEVSIGLT